jgi:hypothetical protein
MHDDDHWRRQMLGPGMLSDGTSTISAVPAFFVGQAGPAGSKDIVGVGGAHPEREKAIE